MRLIISVICGILLATATGFFFNNQFQHLHDTHHDALNGIIEGLVFMAGFWLTYLALGNKQ